MFDNTSVGNCLNNFCLQCGDCLQMFQNKKDADAHKTNNKCTRKIVDGAICSACDSVFDKVELCLRHLQKCVKLRGNQELKFRCSGCKKQFTTRYSCMKHLKSKKCNIKSNKTVFQCSNCSLEFTKKCALVRHINQNVCTNPKNQKCFVEGCNTFFRKNEHLAEHIERVHGNNILFEGSGKKWEVENLKFTSRNEFLQWLISVSNDYNCNYFTSVVKKTTNVTYTNYKCQYDKKNHKIYESRKSLPNLKCPSQICCKTIGGQVMVTYYKTHNHEALNLKRHQIDYSRKMKSSSETVQTVQHFIENANFSDDVLQMESESYLNSISNCNYELSNKGESDNVVDNELALIEESEYLDIPNENSRNLTENTYSMVTNLVVIGDESKETEVFKHSIIESKNSDDGDIGLHKEDDYCKVDSQYCNRSLKYDISELFSNILEYVEGTHNSDLLIQVKSQLSSVLNECINDAKL